MIEATKLPLIQRANFTDQEVIALFARIEALTEQVAELRSERDALRSILERNPDCRISLNEIAR
jgi:hypothetical protein